MLKQLKFAQYKRAITRLTKILFKTDFYNSAIAKEGIITKESNSVTKQQVPSMQFNYSIRISKRKITHVKNLLGITQIKTNTEITKTADSINNNLDVTIIS